MMRLGGAFELDLGNDLKSLNTGSKICLESGLRPAG
jgi:hypothetical protein